MTRQKEEIGQGLEPARAPRPIPAGQRIHVLGAAGAGASAAALLAHHAGALVSGCDPGGPSPYSAALEAAVIPLDWQHSSAHVESTAAPPRRLAVTKALTAVNPDHPELAAARRLGIPAEPWQQLVADAAATAGRRLVGVAGTHGKSTTTGWLVHALVEAGRDPSCFVGALLPGRLAGSVPATGRWGSGELFVVEADEYAGNFDPYRPELVLLLNVEWDHPDVFADESAVVSAIAGWLRAAADTNGRPSLVANAGSPGVRGVLAALGDWPGELLTVALDPAGPEAAQATSEADLVGRVEAVPGAGSRLSVVGRAGLAHEYEVGLAGRHNAENALLVIAAARLLGIEEGPLRASLAGFTGVGRRLELKGEAGGVTVLDDYAHHPTAIERTIEAVRGRFPGRRLWAVYEPLTYHRTAHMLDDFGRVLAQADEVAIADIWAGRDPDTSLTSSAELARAVTARGGPLGEAPGSVEATADYLAGRVRPGDVVLVMGGGRSYVIAERLVGLLRER